MAALCCTHCGEQVLKSMPDGTTKLRSKVIVFKDNSAVIVCKGCGGDIPFPLKIDDTLVKSMLQSQRLKLFVRK